MDVVSDFLRKSLVRWCGDENLMLACNFESPYKPTRGATYGNGSLIDGIRVGDCGFKRVIRVQP